MRISVSSRNYGLGPTLRAGTSGPQASVFGFVHRPYAALPQHRFNLVSSKLLSEQRLWFLLGDHLSGRLQGRRFNESISRLLEAEQGLHFLPQFLIPGTGFVEVGRPLGLFQRQCCLTNALNLSLLVESIETSMSSSPKE